MCSSHLLRLSVQGWRMPRRSSWATGRLWNAGSAVGDLTRDTPGSSARARTAWKGLRCSRVTISPAAGDPTRCRWTAKSRTNNSSNSSSRTTTATTTPTSLEGSSPRNRSDTGPASRRRSSTSWRGASPKHTTLTSSCERNWLWGSAWRSPECRWGRLGVWCW